MKDGLSTKGTLRGGAFGTLPGGKVVSRFFLTNAWGMELTVINIGGCIQTLRIPDKNGLLEDVVLGFDSLEPYLTNSPYLGAIIGRYANRIAKGKFTLEGKEYTLPVNNGVNHLHGGIQGFNKVFWDIETIDNSTLKLSYVSKDGEEGYPGTVSCVVIYQLTEENELIIRYEATTDKTTILNLTQHTYFNLTGKRGDTITDHVLTLKADTFIPVNANLIPTGEQRKVNNSAFDFLKATRIGERIDAKEEQLSLAGGYDHCWVVNSGGRELQHVATVVEPLSGRTVDVWTTEPGIQVYTGNFLDGTLRGKEGRIYYKRSGLCLETQHFPDSPNQTVFPSTVLHPNEKYESTTVFKFGVAHT